MVEVFLESNTLRVRSPSDFVKLNKDPPMTGWDQSHNVGGVDEDISFGAVLENEADCRLEEGAR